MAVNYHIGMVGLTVAAQLPLVDVDPNQHPIDQLQKTLDAAWEQKKATNRLWESFAKGTETARELSDRSHFLHTGVVKRVPGADYPESEDAQPRTKEESMADRIQQAALSGSHQPDRNQPGEELDLAAPKPKLKIPDYENYDNVDPRLGEGPARPKAAACPPQTEQTAIKRDQIRGDHKCKAFEGERSFMLLHVAADIGPESMVRLIVSELHERQIRYVRITEHWLVRRLMSQELNPATIVVVLKTDQASEAATHFHKHVKFQPYLFDLKGSERLEYRSTKDSEPLVSWNMEAVWRREEQRERSRRPRLKQQLEMGPHDSWGHVVDCPQERTFYDIDPR